MCFNISKKYPKALTAEHEIICYKVMTKKYVSIHQDFKYELDNLYKTNFAINPYGLLTSGIDNGVGYLQFGPVINDGFHSFESRNKAYRNRMTHGYPSILETVTCIIPKGAKYYYNPDTEEYVSNQIIIKGI